MKKGYYTIECCNTTWICFYNGSRFVEEDKQLAFLLENYPVEVKRLFKEA